MQTELHPVDEKMKQLRVSANIIKCMSMSEISTGGQHVHLVYTNMKAVH